MIATLYRQWIRKVKTERKIIMNRKSKAEHIFLILILCCICLSALCLAGCGGSCLGCSCSFDNEREESVGRATGITCMANSCLMDRACIATGGCLNIGAMEEDVTAQTGVDSMRFISCETVKNGACSGSSCYRSCYYGSCENFGCVRGSYEEGKADDCAVGCTDGVLGCVDTDGDWHSMLEAIYSWLGVGK